MRKPIPVGEKAETLRKGILERDKGIEPSPRPWQGRVLPLYESRVRKLRARLLFIEWRTKPDKTLRGLCSGRASSARASSISLERSALQRSWRGDRGGTRLHEFLQRWRDRQDQIRCRLRHLLD